MARSRFSFTADVWEHDGPAAWHFVSLPEAVADEIEATYGHGAGGFAITDPDGIVRETSPPRAEMLW